MSRARLRRGARAGMTLVEILVSIALLGLLAVAMTTSLQIGAGSWRGAREALTQDRRIANANQILHSQLAGVVPIQAEPPPGVSAPRGPFFQGEPEVMRFVTSYSWREGVRGGLRAVELSLGRTDEGLRLLLTESFYMGPRSVGSWIVGSAPLANGSGVRMLFAPVRPRPDTLIIADKLARCTFSYLRAPRRAGEAAVWLPLWDDVRQIPEAVRIEMAPTGTSARLMPTTITAALPAKYVPPDEGGSRVDAWGRPLPFIDQSPAGMNR